VVTTTACNACHKRLQNFHSNTRMTTNACDVCHISTFGTPSGNASFVNMVHGLHASRQMNLNYSIAGIVGAEITYPQDIRNCDTCHSPADQLTSFTRGADTGPAYLMMPGVQSCTSCHTSITFPPNAETGKTPHPFNVTASADCSICHTKASIVSNHAVPGAAEVALFNVGPEGAAYEILSVRSTQPGQFPVVKFKVSRSDAADIKASPYWNQVTGSKPSALGIVIAWGTGAYTNEGRPVVAPATNTNGQPIRIDALVKGVTNDSGATWEVTAAEPIPATIPPCVVGRSSTTCSVGITVAIQGHPAIPATATLSPSLRLPVNNAVGFYSPAANPTVGVPATPKAAGYVTLASCNECHKNLSLHGNNRQGSLEVCTTCHNTEAVATGSDPGKTQISVDFKVMIHRIHTANWSIPGTTTSFAEVTYPAPLANCTACHTADPVSVTNPAGLFGSASYFGPQAGLNGTTTSLGAAGDAGNLRTTPWLATCGGCHSPYSGVADAHMRQNGGGSGMTQAEIDAMNGGQPAPALRAQ
jgi:OmcA/MtrC family decaheme c-type cytochrome